MVAVMQLNMRSTNLVYTNQSLGINFYTAGTSTNRLHIDNNGNVGIGTTNSTQQLVIQGVNNTDSLRILSTSGIDFSNT